eukprot:6104260-Alexandrium_andersonii.AAC.1
MRDVSAAWAAWEVVPAVPQHDLELGVRDRRACNDSRDIRHEAPSGAHELREGLEDLGLVLRSSVPCCHSILA